MNIRIDDFKGMVHHLSCKRINSIFSPQDIEQELWCKLFKVLPKFKHLESKDVFSLAKAVLTNHLSNIRKSQAIRTDTSDYSNGELAYELSEEELIRNGANELDIYSLHVRTPHEEYLDKELEEEICEWSSGKSEECESLVNGLLDGEKPYALDLPSYDVTKNLNELRNHLKTKGFKNTN